MKRYSNADENLHFSRAPDYLFSCSLFRSNRGIRFKTVTEIPGTNPGCHRRTADSDGFAFAAGMQSSRKMSATFHRYLPSPLMLSKPISLRFPVHRPWCDLNLLRVFVIIVPCLLFCLFAAHARRYRASGARGKYVDSMIAFRPAVHVSLISDRNAMHYSDSFSRVSRVMHEALMEKYATKLKLRELVKPADPVPDSLIEAEIDGLFVAAEGKKYLEDGLVCPLIDSVAKAKGMRFVLLFNSGFLRTTANFRDENAKGVVTSLATLGMYTRVPIPARSQMRTMVLDMQERQTYYYSDAYGTQASVDQSPVRPDALEKQLNGLFTMFFWSAPL
jgi:hypothetical protein